MIIRQRKNEIVNLLEDMKIKLSNENEQLCVEAIQTLFVSIDNLDLLNKRAILLYIREISGLEKKQMSKSMSIIRKLYRSMVKDKELYDIF